MSGLNVLTNEDFYIYESRKGPLMCHRIKGFSLVLFYRKEIDVCKEARRVFGELAQSYFNFNFVLAVINRYVYELSMETIAPIDEIPRIILYKKGRPSMFYNGPITVDNIMTFLDDVEESFRQKQDSLEHVKTYAPKEGRGIPVYSIGIPVMGIDVAHYLTEYELHLQQQE